MVKLHYHDSPSEKEKKSFAQYLAEDEELIVATGLGSAYLRQVFIIAILWPGIIFWGVTVGVFYYLHQNLGIGFFLGFGIALVVALLRAMHTYHAHRYLLTTRRVIIKEGVFAVKLTSAMYDKITHIEVDQAFLDKLLLHHGTIIVNTAGTNFC